MPVAREKNNVAPRDLAEDQRRRRLAVGCAYDFAASDGERGQAGEPLPPMMASMESGG